MKKMADGERPFIGVQFAVVANHLHLQESLDLTFISKADERTG